jgi:hypothetical protein
MTVLGPNVRSTFFLFMVRFQRGGGGLRGRCDGSREVWWLRGRCGDSAGGVNEILFVYFDTGFRQESVTA